MPIDLTPYEHLCYNCKEIIPAGALRFEKDGGNWCVYCFPERKELMRCGICFKRIGENDIIHTEEDVISCNSCYVDRAFKEFEGICPIENRWEILDIR